MQNDPENKFDFLKGEVLLIDKPLTWTSFDVVNKIRLLLKYACGIKKIKVGHAGTLDPMASGLLIVCTGKATKEIEKYQAQEKEYTGSFTLGVTTPSFDSETETDKEYPVDHITPELLQSAISNLTGWIDQVPPVYSAIKIKGERAYKFARANEDIQLKSRKVLISEFEITNFQLPLLQFRIVCSKGTYIRSIARDLGKNLNSGAYLSSLRRIRIGDFKIEEALGIEPFQGLVEGLYKNNT